MKKPVVISFTNMKGGVGKTTLCVNLAFEIFRGAKKVLVVDNDPQFNSTSALMKPEAYIYNIIKTDECLTIYYIYEKPPRIRGKKQEKLDAKKFFYPTWHIPGRSGAVLDLIPSQIELYDTLSNPSHKEYLLDKFLKRHATKYDYIFIDCPPTPSVLTLSGFAASDYVVIPVTPDYYATMGLPQFLGTLRDFKDRLLDPHGVTPLGVIFTNVERRMSTDTTKSMSRDRETLADLSEAIPVFDSKMSHFKVYEKSLWQSVPVQRVTGRGTRGKSQATYELLHIENELNEKIKLQEGMKAENG